jgi:hypothetical protein
MVILSLKLDKLFMLHVPLLVMFRHGHFLSKTKVGGCGVAKKTKRSANSKFRRQTTGNDRFAKLSFLDVDGLKALLVLCL